MQPIHYVPLVFPQFFNSIPPLHPTHVANSSRPLPMLILLVTSFIQVFWLPPLALLLEPHFFGQPPAGPYLPSLHSPPLDYSSSIIGHPNQSFFLAPVLHPSTSPLLPPTRVALYTGCRENVVSSQLLMIVLVHCRLTSKWMLIIGMLTHFLEQSLERSEDTQRTQFMV